MATHPRSVIVSFRSKGEFAK